MKIVTVENASATQTEHPVRSTVRTFLQASLLAFPILLALPEILAIVDDELGAYLSDDIRGWLALVAGVIAAGAAALARVMAVPAIEKALRGIGLGAAPADPPFGHWDGGPDESDEDESGDADISDVSGPSGSVTSDEDGETIPAEDGGEAEDFDEFVRLRDRLDPDD